MGIFVFSGGAPEPSPSQQTPISGMDTSVSGQLPAYPPGSAPANFWPKPDRFRIVERFVVGRYTVLGVQYEGCPNHDGAKILVYDEPIRGTPKTLDPHFLEDGELVPVARFEPTPRGVEMLHMMLQGLIANGHISLAAYHAAFGDKEPPKLESNIPARVRMAKIP